MDVTQRVDATSLARRVADAIGDGCAVRLLDGASRRLAVAAVDHRDPVQRERLAAAVEPIAWSATRGWGAHVLRCGRPLRVEAAAGAGAREEFDRFAAEAVAALLAPVRAGDGETVGVAIALRDRGGVPYSLREQTLLERIVAREAACDAAAEADADAACADDRELARQLLARSDAGIWATDLTGRTLALTPALSELLGVPIGAMGGLPIGDFLDPPPTSIVGAVPEETERGDRRLRRADGVTLWVATSSTPLVDAAGRRRGTLTTVVDVTERKRVEIGLRMQLRAARGVTRMLAGVLRGQDPAELLDHAAETAADILGVRRTGVFELRRDGSLLLRAGVGWPPGAIGRHRAATLGSPAALALTGDEAVVVRDTAAVGSGVAGSETRSGCWVGVAGGRGVLAALHDEPRDFDRDERALLVSLAEAIGGCVGVPARAVVRREDGAAR